jgi:tellurite resistance protein TehA-like permease
MLLYGLLLPEHWRQSFGIIAGPIAWAASNVPAIAKATSASPVPELVAGFFGTGLWSIFSFVVALLWKDPLGDRVRYAFSRPGRSP